MQNNIPTNQNNPGFSTGSQRALMAAIIIMGIMIIVGIGVVIYVSVSRYMHSKAVKPVTTTAVTKQDAKPNLESTYGSVLMVPRQGGEVVHSAISMPDGKLAVVMFPGFAANSAAKEPVKKDPNNTADGGRILLWDPSTGHITQEMRISSIRPDMHP